MNPITEKLIDATEKAIVAAAQLEAIQMTRHLLKTAKKVGQVDFVWEAFRKDVHDGNMAAFPADWWENHEDDMRRIWETACKAVATTVALSHLQKDGPDKYRETLDANPRKLTSKALDGLNDDAFDCAKADLEVQLQKLGEAFASTHMLEENGK